MAELTTPKTVETVQRQLAILGRIPRQPRQVRITDLHAALKVEGMDVTVRTIQRDLVNLSRRFPIMSDERIGQGGAVWFWREDAAGFDAPGMDPSTALALLSVRDHLKMLLPAVAVRQLGSYFRRAEQVLGQVSGQKLNQWRKKVRVLDRGLQLAAPTVSQEVQSAVEDAILRNLQLHSTYRGRSTGKDKEQVLNPLALVTKGGVQYLVATAWNYEKPVHYALHRFKAAEVLPDAAKIPDGFGLDRYLEHEKAFSYPESPDQIRLEIAAVQQLAFHLQERPLGRDQRQIPIEDGRVRLTVTCDDTAELRWWLMGLGEQVEVLAPKAMRDEICANLCAAAARYRESRSTRSFE